MVVTLTGFLRRRTEMPAGSVMILADGAEIRILPVEDETEESISAGGLAIPRDQAQVYYRPEGGRAYLIGATPPVLQAAEQVERIRTSAVLRATFDYKQPGTAWGFPQLFLAGLLALVLVVAIIK